MLFVFLLSWKGKTKLLQKWILCQDNQIKSNHNHIYKHFILRLSYFLVTVKYMNTTSKYHFIGNFHQNNHWIQLWIKDLFFKVKFFEIIFITWQVSIYDLTLKKINLKRKMTYHKDMNDYNELANMSKWTKRHITKNENKLKKDLSLT